jgi:hypothetical protein
MPSPHISNSTLQSYEKKAADFVCVLAFCKPPVEQPHSEQQTSTYEQSAVPRSFTDELTKKFPRS